MLKLLISSVVLSVSLVAGEMSIAVAANMADAIEVLKTEFIKNNPSTKINTVLGSSGKLTAQINNGAPFALFFSADMKFPESLYANNMAVSKPVIYASGALAMMSVKGLDLSKGLDLLSDANVVKIAIANPKTAPYGTAAVEAFKNAHVYEAIESKLVFGESISQTVQYATTATDVGFVNKSAFYSPKMKAYQEGKEWVSVDPKYYTPIAQGVVLLKPAINDVEAKAFYDFVLTSPQAKAILRDFGYIVP